MHRICSPLVNSQQDHHSLLLGISKNPVHILQAKRKTSSTQNSRVLCVKYSLFIGLAFDLHRSKFGWRKNYGSGSDQNPEFNTASMLSGSKTWDENIITSGIFAYSWTPIHSHRWLSQMEWLSFTSWNFNLVLDIKENVIFIILKIIIYNIQSNKGNNSAKTAKYSSNNSFKTNHL